MNNLIEICFKGAWIKLQDFEELSEKTDSCVSFNYFITLIDFFADLCLDRNYIAIDYLENLYEFQFCITIITNNMYPASLRFLFIIIIINLIYFLKLKMLFH